MNFTVTCHCVWPWAIEYVWYFQCQPYISFTSSAELILLALLWKIFDCMSHWKWSVAQFFLQHWPAEWQDTGPTLWTGMKGDAVVWIWIHSRQVWRCSMCLIFSRLWSGVIKGTKWVQASNVSGSFELKAFWSFTTSSIVTRRTGDWFPVSNISHEYSLLKVM